MTKKALIIFTRNPELGKVKTRLAKTVGNDAAYHIYQQLIKVTETATSKVKCVKHIYFSNEITNTFWTDDLKLVQRGSDLGERMLNAFKDTFSKGFDHVVLIGSDLPEISTEIINKAFTELNKNEIVFGPSEDGGYYLIGMSKLHPCVFTNKPWSTTHLLSETIAELKHKIVDVSLLQTLNDIDTFEDLKQFPEFLKLI